MPSKVRPQAFTGPRAGCNAPAACGCPECEVELPGGLRFSLALGILESQGWHVHRDLRETVEWTATAARRGQVPAQRSLGLRYASGRGIPQNYVRAYAWLNIAAAGGDETARASRDQLRRRMTRRQVADGQRLSLEWFERQRPPKAG